MAAPNAIADRFREAMLAGDSTRLTALVTPDVSFVGPLARVSGAEATVAGLVEMGNRTTADDVHVQLGDNSDVLIWSVVATDGAAARPAVTWLHLDGERISSIETVFNVG